MNNLVKDEDEEKDKIEDEVDEDSIGAALFEEVADNFKTFCNQYSDFKDKIAEALKEDIIDIVEEGEE